MEPGVSVTTVARWRIADSRDVFWVGLDENENVITTRLETTSP